MIALDCATVGAVCNILTNSSLSIDESHSGLKVGEEVCNVVHNSEWYLCLAVGVVVCNFAHNWALDHLNSYESDV